MSDPTGDATGLIALTRAVSPTLEAALVSHVARQSIDMDLAVRQHAAYEALLTELGATVVPVPEAPDLPDAVFVEDCAVVLDEIAVVARPGARARLPEVDAVAATLARYRECAWVEGPGTLDGGDVLVLGQTIYVGRSSRTNDSGIDQLLAAVAPYGYAVLPVEFGGALHLKSVCTALEDETLFLDPRRVDVTQFRECEYLAVPGDEWPAVNTVLVHETVVMAAGYPEAVRLVESTGRAVRAIDISEFAKVEGGVSCKSILMWA
jgi:dimethylargininase